MFNKGDKIMLVDGSLGIIEGVVKTERKNIYKISCLKTGHESYFEEDKLVLHERRSGVPIWKKITSLFSGIGL